MIAEKVEPQIRHLHVDAQEWPDELEQLVRALGFEHDDFVGHPEGFRHFEPKMHMTKKVRTQDEFDESWTELERACDQTGFVGYLEGEFIKTDEFIPHQAYHDVRVPFRITRRRLTGSAKERFRQGEIHLTLDKDRSDPRLIKNMLEAGLYGAYLPKTHGTFIVLTIQGFAKDIFAVGEALRSYLAQAGGAVGCTLKEELAIRYKLYGITSAECPEIVDQVLLT
jgi:hypothetical protein